MIRSGADVAGGFTERAEVCVIGSGAGGGVSAALHAEAGRDVVLLEEGPHVPGSAMTQREEEMYPLLYRDGGNQSTDDGAVSVLQGRVLGGSTVVNMADVEPIPAEVIDHWRTRYGLSRFGVADVREAEADCRAAIGANRIPASELNRNAMVLLEGGRALGIAGRAFDHNRLGCVGSGYCLVGCAYDAKRSVALTWVPRALETGRLLVQTEARVSRLEVRGGRVVAAVGDVVRSSDSAALAPFRVEADRFVLAAGTIHSPLLLQASGIGGRAVGANLSLQPQTPVAALFPQDVVGFRGIPQAAFLDGTETVSAEAGLGGFRLESVFATPGMAAVTTALPPDAVHALMARYRQMAACLCLVPDQPTGTVTGHNGRPRIRYAATDDVKARLKEAARTAARVYLAAGAEQVFLPFAEATPVRSEADLAQLDGLRIRTGSTPLLSAHPQGTCRMGPDPATSVVGPDLRVHGVANLQVADASVFPTTAATHTMLPVMSYAWLAART